MRHALALACLLAWTLTLDAIVNNGDGTRTITVTARNEAGAVVETRAFVLSTTLPAGAARNEIRHYFHQKKYPPPADPAPAVGQTITLP